MSALLLLIEKILFIMFTLCCLGFDGKGGNTCPMFCVCNKQTLTAVCCGHYSQIPQFPRYIQHLELHNADLHVLNRSVLSKVTHLVSLSLRNDSIRSVQPSAFTNFSSLKYLDLSDNPLNISTLHGNSLNLSLKTLILNNAIFKNIPTNNLEKVIHLKTLSLVDNRIKVVLQKHFQFWKELSVLDLSGNPIVKIEPNSFFSLAKLDKLYLNRLKSAILREKGLSIFNSYLKEIYIKDNNLTLSSKVAIFQNLTKLEVLDISGNRVLWNGGCAVLFKGLRNLYKLYLSNTGITDIPSDFSRTLPSLKYIDMSFNNISMISAASLHNATNINSLMLKANAFTDFSMKELPVNILRTLKVLDVSQNPFTCTCSMHVTKVMRQLQAGNVSVVNYPDDYTCHSTKSHVQRTVVSFYRQMCRKKKKSKIVVTVSLTVVAVFVIVVVSITYPTRQRIEHWFMRKAQSYEEI